MSCVSLIVASEADASVTWASRELKTLPCLKTSKLSEKKYWCESHFSQCRIENTSIQRAQRQLKGAFVTSLQKISQLCVV